MSTPYERDERNLVGGRSVFVFYMIIFIRDLVFLFDNDDEEEEKNC